MGKGNGELPSERTKRGGRDVDYRPPSATHYCVRLVQSRLVQRDDAVVFFDFRNRRGPLSNRGGLYLQYFTQSQNLLLFLSMPKFSGIYRHRLNSGE